MKTPTALERARSAKPATKGKPDRENAQLAIAWARDEIKLSQVNAAIGISGSATYSVLARGLRDAVRLGLPVNGAKRV
jgi:hypothetical protein